MPNGGMAHPRSKYGRTSAKLLSEKRIMTTSTPYIHAELLIESKLKKQFEKTKTMSYDRILERQKSELITANPEALESIIIPFQYITDAEIEGMTPMARRGKISIVDPHAEWPEILTAVGATANSTIGRGYPNIKITFGWAGIRPKGQDTFKLEHLNGMITAVAMDFDPGTGVFTATINFIEYATELIDAFRFTKIADIVALNSMEEFDHPKGSGARGGAVTVTKSLKELIEKVIEVTSLKEDLTVMSAKGDTELCKITFIVDESQLDVSHELKLKKKFRVEYGAYFTSVIDELASRVSLKQDKDDKDNYSFERLSVKWDDSGKNCTVVYGWRKSSDVNPENLKQDDLMAKDFGELPYGILLWKRSVTGDEDSPFNLSKRIVSWQMDLASHEWLIHMAGEELDKRINQFQEDHDISSWDNILVEAEGSTAENPKYELSRRAEWFKGNPEGWGRKVVGVFSKKDEGVEAYQEAQEIEGQAGDSGAFQARLGKIKSILDMNAFKATCQVMGDPTIGTKYPAMAVRFVTNFEGANEFHTYFNRNWVLLNTKHLFKAGSYITEMELLAYPETKLVEKSSGPSADSDEEKTKKETRQEKKERVQKAREKWKAGRDDRKDERIDDRKEKRIENKEEREKLTTVDMRH